MEALLKAKVQELTPLPGAIEVRDRVIKRIDATVRQGFGGCTGFSVKPYGSHLSGTSTTAMDLDLSIQAEAIRRLDSPGEYSVWDIDYLGNRRSSDLNKYEKGAVLRSLHELAEAGDANLGYGLKLITTARVPVLKFVDTESGFDCDLTVGNSDGIFKGLALKHLVDIDPRVPALIRLVKAWAKANGINNAHRRCFNSHALTMMVIFLLQTRPAPILPPICSLFDLSKLAVVDRPLHAGRLPDFSSLQGFGRRAAEWSKTASPNSESLHQLLSEFFHLYSSALDSWRHDQGTRRCSTWAGEWLSSPWPDVRYFYYVASIEEPFDSLDNCGRSIHSTTIDGILRAFRMAAYLVDSVPEDDTPEGVMRLLFD